MTRWILENLFYGKYLKVKLVSAVRKKNIIIKIKIGQFPVKVCMERCCGQC